MEMAHTISIYEGSRWVVLGGRSGFSSQEEALHMLEQFEDGNLSQRPRCQNKREVRDELRGDIRSHLGEEYHHTDDDWVRGTISG